MIDDQLQLSIKNLINLRNEHRDLKKDITTEKKRAMENLIELKDLLNARKQLTDQINDKKQHLEEELSGSDMYHQLREDAVLKEEEIQQEKGKLFELIEKLNKNTPIEMKVELDDGTLVKFQMIPAKNVYINGREEKQE